MTDESEDSGWLVPVEHRQLTPNRYNRGDRRILPIDLAIYHYTAGAFDGSIRWLCSTNSSASAHFIVKKDGAIWQLASIFDRTWHAGGQTSRWRDQPGVNMKSIGIEIENLGPITEADGVYTAANGHPFSGTVARDADGKPWDAYEADQITALESLTRKLVRAFPILSTESDRLVGHQDVDPTRKIDPGPVFPWDRIRTAAGVALTTPTTIPPPPVARRSSLPVGGKGE